MMKVKPVKLGKTERMSFSHIDEVISMPNLIEVQKNSYQCFLDEGLKEVFHDIGTIEDYTGNLALLTFIFYGMSYTRVKFEQTHIIRPASCGTFRRFAQTFRVYTVLVSHNGLVRQKGNCDGCCLRACPEKFVKNAERFPSTRVELCLSAQI